jgi:hypothetical protein
VSEINLMKRQFICGLKKSFNELSMFLKGKQINEISFKCLIGDALQCYINDFEVSFKKCLTGIQ